VDGILAECESGAQVKKAARTAKKWVFSSDHSSADGHAQLETHELNLKVAPAHHTTAACRRLKALR